MANLAPAEEFVATDGSQNAQPPRAHAAGRSHLSNDSQSVWNTGTISGILLLFILWAVKLYTTWGAWGNLTIDSGHELYVPAMLAQGRQLYRDLWFPFGPGAPYFTSYLFRLFGARLEVLYWAGALSALGSSIFLFLTGRRLGSWFAGLGAGAVLLLEAFHPSLFCFPLPYSSAAVYGCLIGCLFLWAAVHASYSTNWKWIFTAGIVAAISFLLKPEFGLSAYCCLALLIATRALLEKSWTSLAKNVLMILPGIVVCGLVIRWMVAIAGADFITQENIQSWPSSYFMRRYGKAWLERTGFTVSGSAFVSAFHRGVTIAVVLLVLWILMRWRGSDTRAVLGKGLLVVALAWYLVQKNFFMLSFRDSISLVMSVFFFPGDMVLYVIFGGFAAWCSFLLKPALGRKLAIPLLFTFSGLLGFRVLMKMNSTGYPIYFNGPAVLSFLLLLGMLIPKANRSRRFVLLAEGVLCLACLTPVFLIGRKVESEAKDFVAYSTGRGTIRTLKSTARIYKAAVNFMQERAALGQSVLSVPEDTSLYFLSGTICPTRIYLFIPGAVAPGIMTEKTIDEIERKHVEYLLWSNRTFPEYGTPEFGIDFDKEIGRYLKANYHSVGRLIPNDPASKLWSPVVWERNREGQR